MEITLSGRGSERGNMVLAMAHFYAIELRITRSKYNLSIVLKQGMSKENHMRGVLSLNPENPRELIMFLDNRLNFDLLCTTLAHEMVHVKQYARGQIKAHTRGKKVTYTWLGKKFSGNYYDSPWELDAFRNERLLANKIARLL